MYDKFTLLNTKMSTNVHMLRFHVFIYVYLCLSLLIFFFSFFIYGFIVVYLVIQCYANALVENLVFSITI